MAKPKRNYVAPDQGAHAKDCFQTPPYAVDPLVPYLRAAGVRTVWEPAAGAGYLVRWLSLAGFDVIAGDIQRGDDFFATTAPLGDCQVTNVPFSRKYPWIAHSCQLGRPFALLMPAEAMFAGEEAVPLIEQYDLRMLLPRQRIDYKTPSGSWAESSAQMATGWLTYRLGLPERLTYCTIAKPDKRTLRQWDAEERGQLRLFEVPVSPTMFDLPLAQVA